MDRLTPVTADPAARLFAAFMAGAPSDPVLDVLANLCVRSLRRIDELDAVAAAKRALAHRAVCATSQPEGSGGDLSLILAESDGLLASIEVRQLAHARNLRQTLSMAVRLTRRRDQAVVLPSLPRLFRREEGCWEYLCAFQLGRGVPCDECGAHDFLRIIARPTLQCRRCATQVSCRRDTIMENSRLALPKWFGAIQVFLSGAKPSSEELAAHLRIKRSETARQLRCRVLDALNQENRTTLLADLDQFFGATPALSARSPLTESPDIGDGFFPASRCTSER